MQSSGSQPPSTPSEPSGPEITAAPSKRGLPRRTLVIIIVAIIILGAVGAFLFVYLGTGSVLVTSNSQFIPAGSSTSFTATVTPPSFVSVNSIQWNFGDGQQQAATGTNPSHSYSNPGNYYVLATASLSNGKTSDNSQGLFPVQVGDPPLPANPNPFGVARSFGILSFNKTLPLWESLAKRPSSTTTSTWTRSGTRGRTTPGMSRKSSWISAMDRLPRRTEPVTLLTRARTNRRSSPHTTTRTAGSSSPPSR